MKRTRVLCLCFALAAGASRGATYYVDYAGGSDTNAGVTMVTPFKHCPGDGSASGVAAATGLHPGDTVDFKGGVAYFGTVNLNWSGSAAAGPVTYDGNSSGQYGTGRAVFNNQHSTAYKVGFIATYPQNYVTLRNFEFTRIGGFPDSFGGGGCTSPVSTTMDGKAIDLTSGGGNLRVENCYFHEIGEWRNMDPLIGDAICGTGVAVQNVTNAIVDGCEFTRMSIGASIKVNDQSTITGVEVKNCNFHSYLRWGVDIAPRSLNTTITGISIHNNLIHDYTEYDSVNWRGCGEKPHTDGIFVRCDYNNTTWGSVRIFNNEFYNTTNSGGGTACIYVTDGPNADIFNNTFINTLHGRTVYLNNGSRSGASPQVVRIYNNTFFNDRTAINLQSDGPASELGEVRILNNIFSDPRTGSGNNFAVFIEDAGSQPRELDHNLYQSFNTFGLLLKWNGAAGEIGMTGIRAQGWESHGVVADPFFVDTSNGMGPLCHLNNLHLLPTSFAIGAGTNVAAVVAADKDGAARTDPWDIGAYDYIQIVQTGGQPKAPTHIHPLHPVP